MMIQTQVQLTEDGTERAMRVAGMFSSGIEDVSADHDRHLAVAFHAVPDRDDPPSPDLIARGH